MTEKDKIIEEPILTIEDLSVKLLSKEFIDWYFKDKQANRIINLFKQSQKQKIIEEIKKTSKRWYRIIKKNIKDKYWQSSELNLIQQIEKELLNSLGEKQQ